MDPTKVQPEPQREEKPAAYLTRHEWIQAIAEDGIDLGEVRVLHVETYEHELLRRLRAIVLYKAVGERPQSFDIDAEYTVPLLTEDEVGEKLDEERRMLVADQFTRLGELVTEGTIPLPRHRPILVDWNLGHDSAAVEAVAKELGEPLLPANTQVSVFRHGDTDFGPGVTVEWHAFRTGPKPLVDPDASMEAHYDAEADNPVRHPSWPTEAELKPWESLAPEADRMAESLEPKVPFDGTGFDYTRPADDPQPAGHREPMHTGAVTDGGLVDETPAAGVTHYPDGDGFTLCGLDTPKLPERDGVSSAWGFVTCPTCSDKVRF